MTEQKHKIWAFIVVKYQLIQCPILLQPFPAQRWQFQLNKKLRIQMKHVLSINIHKPNCKSNFVVKRFIVCVSSVAVKSIFIPQIYLQSFTLRLTTYCHLRMVAMYDFIPERNLVKLTVLQLGPYCSMPFIA